jgi:DNA-binding transcriptional ArsR family regulator
LRAINSPLRREILRVLKDGCEIVEDLRSKTGLSKEKLEWHLSVSEHGFCIERDVEGSRVSYRLTQEGKVVDYIE